MILCVDTTSLGMSVTVQKDVNVLDLLTKHTKYFEDWQSARKENYVPLDFCVSVRTLYTNQVLESDKGDKKLYYVNMSQVQEMPHKGFDLVMYLGSIALLNCIDYNAGFDDLMMKHSQFQPIGLYCLDPFILNPIIYSHILISDEGAEEFKKYLKGDRKLVSIDTMRQNTSGNIKALLDTIIKVKEYNNEQ